VAQNAQFKNGNAEARTTLASLLEKKICTVADVEESVKGFLIGDITLAQLEGHSADELYRIADIGYTFLEEGKLTEARNIFEGLFAYNPYDPYFHATLGSICQRQSDWDKALGHYACAVQLYPEDINSWTNAGEIMLQRSLDLLDHGQVRDSQEMFGEAVAAFGKAIALDPNGNNPSGLRARALVSVTANAVEASQAA
jgi:tetratricopeptide (TPR) repeat protein